MSQKETGERQLAAPYSGLYFATWGRQVTCLLKAYRREGAESIGRSRLRIARMLWVKTNPIQPLTRTGRVYDPNSASWTSRRSSCQY